MKLLEIEVKTKNGLVTTRKIEYEEIVIDNWSTLYAKSKNDLIFVHEFKNYMYEERMRRSLEEIESGYLSLDTMWADLGYVRKNNLKFAEHIKLAFKSVDESTGYKNSWRELELLQGLTSREIDRMLEGKFKPIHLCRQMGQCLYVPKQSMYMGPTNFYKTLKL